MADDGFTFSVGPTKGQTTGAQTASPSGSAIAAAMRPASTGKLLNAAGGYEDIELSPTKKADGNTVMTIIVYGSKDSGKSCLPAGLALRLGGRKVIVACDDTTEETLRNYYGAEFFDSAELYEVTRRRVRNIIGPDGKAVMEIYKTPEGVEKSRPKVEELYPGFDPDRPWTAELVITKLAKLMDRLEKEGGVEIFILDHFQALYEKVAASYARYKAGRGPEQRMQLEDWMYRTETMDYIEAKTRRLPMPGGIAVITGYGPQEKTTYGDEVTMPDGKKKRPVVKVITEPKWLKEDIRRNWHVILEASYQRETDGNVIGAQVARDRYFVDVINSKTPRFPKGVKVEVTGKSLELFWSERHLIPKEA